MTRPGRILTLLIFAAGAWGGFTIYQSIAKTHTNEKKIEGYKQRLSLNKKTAQDLEESKRTSQLRSAPQK